MAGGMEGLDKLMRKLDALGTQVAGETLERAVNASTKTVQAEARLNCAGFRIPTGELRQSIRTKVNSESDRVIGVVYTNKEYAPYVEFGTGPAGEADHQGISPNATPTYSQKGWIIPAKAMDREKAESYGLGVVEKADEVIGYLTNGQPAHPFLYPALKNNEGRVKRNIANYIARAIKEAANNG